MKKKMQKEIQNLGRELLEADAQFSTSEFQKKTIALYEKLCVLQYLENQLEGTNQPDSAEKAESYDSKSFREQNWFTEPEPIPRPQHKEDLVEPLIEKIKDLVAQMPTESEQVDEILDQILPEKKYMKNDLEEFASNYQQTPTFERKPSAEAPKNTTVLEERHPAKGVEVPTESKRLIADLGMSEKPRSINDSAGNGMQIGLNDRLAYIKHLFSGDDKQYEETLKKITTMQSYAQAETHIKTKIKPQHNFWLQKDMFAERFMAAVERKFS